MSPRELQRIVRDMAGKSDEAVDRALREQRLEVQDRLSVKIELQAQSQQRTMAASLATDGAEWHPAEQSMQPLTEIERLMQRAGLQAGMKYTEADIEEGCRRAGIVEPGDRLGIKIEAEQRGMLKPRQVTEDSRRLYAMRASADEQPASKKVLRDPRTGKAAVLRFLP